MYSLFVPLEFNLGYQNRPKVCLSKRLPEILKFCKRWKNITENILSGCFLFYCLWVNHIQTQHYNTAVKVSGDIISQVTTEKCISHDKKKASSKTGYSETEDQHVLRRHLEIRSCCVTDLNITRHTHKCDTPLIHSFIYFANTHS